VGDAVFSRPTPRPRPRLRGSIDEAEAVAEAEAEARGGNWEGLDEVEARQSENDVNVLT